MPIFTVFNYKTKNTNNNTNYFFSELDIEAHVQPEDIIKKTINRGNIEYNIHGFINPTALLHCSDQYHVNKNSVLMDGFLYRYDTLSDEHIDAKYISENFSIDLFRNVAGEYGIINISDAGILTAMSDPERIRSLYYTETSELFAISTRPSMLARLLGSGRLDLNWIAAVSSIGYGLGPNSPYQEIKAIPQDNALIWDGERVNFRRIGRRSILENRGVSKNSRAFDSDLDESICAATNAVRIASQGNDAIHLAITGGKDSRLLLALCLAGGLKDRLILFTQGEPDHPDCVVGKMIAERIGIRHEIRVPPLAKDASLGPQSFLERIGISSYQTDGLCGCWDMILGKTTGKGLTMSGFMGEIMKSYDKMGRFNPESSIDPIGILKLQSPFDPIGFLSGQGRFLGKTVRESLSDYLFDRFKVLLEEGFTKEDLPDLFYYENRIPNWLGNTRQVHSFTGTNIMPLGVPPLVRMAFTATAEERSIEQIHFSAIKKTAPELLEIPFALQRWHPSLGVPARGPVTMPNRAMPVHGSWQHSVNKVPAVRSAISSLIEGSDSELWSVVDRNRLIERLQGGPLNTPEIISLLGTLPMLFFTTETFQPQKLATAESEYRPVPWTPLKQRLGFRQRSSNTESPDGARAALERLQSDLAEAKAELIDLRNYGRELEMKHVSILESSTWRAMEPVRYLLRRMKRRPTRPPFIPRLGRSHLAKKPALPSAPAHHGFAAAPLTGGEREKKDDLYGSRHHAAISGGIRKQETIGQMTKRLPPEAPGGIRNLQIGCGPAHIRTDWWNTDLRAFEGIDEELDAAGQWRWKDILDHVYAEHFLEHLTLEDAVRFLSNAGRALRVGGHVRLSTPSLEWVMRSHFSFAAPGSHRQVLDALRTNRAFHGWGHRFLYSKGMLQWLCGGMGYVDVRFCDYGESTVPAFQNIEMHGNYTITEGCPSVWIVEATRGGAEIGLRPDMTALLRKEFLNQVKGGH